MVNSRAELPDIIAGHTYGRWTVIEKLKITNKWKESLHLCECKCGVQRVILSRALKNGRSKSCGCLKVKHGKARSGAANSWYLMVARCTNPDNPNYAQYGGRGITICDRWMDLNNFIADMGERPPKATIDRIDVNGSYSPENCRWASRKQQCNNNRRNRHVTYNGKQLTIGELADLTGKNYFTVYSRIVKYKWTIEKSVM